MSAAHCTPSSPLAASLRRLRLLQTPPLTCPCCQQKVGYLYHESGSPRCLGCQLDHEEELARFDGAEALSLYTCSRCGAENTLLTAQRDGCWVIVDPTDCAFCGHDLVWGDLKDEPAFLLAPAAMEA